MAMRMTSASLVAMMKKKEHENIITELESEINYIKMSCTDVFYFDPLDDEISEHDLEYLHNKITETILVDINNLLTRLTMLINFSKINRYESYKYLQDMSSLLYTIRLFVFRKFSEIKAKTIAAKIQVIRDENFLDTKTTYYTNILFNDEKFINNLEPPKLERS
ncbi:hypothetical protein [Heterosigma akashiwo virus 01]|jgi:hypothetical protein|uniref:Uncharacterized protein n=1 Tax=Heterosigma akashiwo virus 01 TaxID=97195 RepID=A0A1C9C5L1_HAV01|nr:hypothetical protein D1R72_gp235 [Heterosigma akashiwo virus 01]AOM63566.1 hypothetical protein [Heterosigma akashiwo virus 01]